MLQALAVTELCVCFVAWSFAFVGARRLAAGQKKVVRATSSRWGIVLQAIGFSFTFAYIRPAGYEKSDVSLVISMILSPVAAILGWLAVRHLGKQWRYEAALSEDHELIMSGPYRWLRHPIYASIFGFLLAGCTAWTWWPMAIGAVIFFLIGTEVRVRAEDRLLEDRFGERFRVYRAGVRAYIPFIR